MTALNAAITWQPLHTPRAKLSPRPKKAANCSASAGFKRNERAQPSPAPSMSPSLKSPQATRPWNGSSRARPACRSPASECRSNMKANDGSRQTVTTA